MNTGKIKHLLEKYFEGETTPEEEESIRAFFRSEEVPDELSSYAGQFRQLEGLESLEPPEDMDLFGKIDFESDQAVSAVSDNDGVSHRTMVWSLRIAAGLILLLIGFSAGLLLTRQESVSSKQVAALQQEISRMKNALVYGSYQQTTASQRISAVNMTNRIPAKSEELDAEISEILIYTMNNDENTNVRQAAADALFRFRDEARIRQALVNSLGKQEDPVMQMTLINMLVQIKAKAAIHEMQKLLMSSDTRDVVKARLKNSIAELKA